MKINLFELYTPKQLAEMTMNDIKAKRHMEEYEHKRKERDVDTFLRERAWAHKKVSGVKR
jgi:hypothetical protein